MERGLAYAFVMLDARSASYFRRPRMSAPIATLAYPASAPSVDPLGTSLLSGRLDVACEGD